jgi:hypothetical protein
MRIKGRGPMNNGDSMSGVPPDLVFSDDVYFYSCSQHTEHEATCMGNCEKVYPDEYQVMLINE